MTAGERLKQLSTLTGASAAAMLLTIGQGATAGAVLTDYAGFGATAGEMLLYEQVAPLPDYYGGGLSGWTTKPSKQEATRAIKQPREDILPNMIQSDNELILRLVIAAVTQELI